MKTVLNAQSTNCTEVSRPLGVELSFQVESALFVGEVPWRDEECEADPEKERVESKERAIVKEDASPAKDGGDCCCCCRCRGENELGTVTRANDVSTFKDVKPGHQTENESSDGIYGQL